MGVQTFDPKLLKQLNRGHTSEQVYRAIDLFSGENFSLDLIFALPGQTLEMLERDIDKLLEINPPHLSIYNLSYEPGSLFYKLREQHKLIPASDDLEYEMYLLILNKLSQKGFKRYEVSNFARDGKISQHNMLYWSNTPYLGVGPGAHSYYEKEGKLIRSIKEPQWKKYLKASPENLETQEILTDTDYLFDCFHTMLRRGKIDFNQFYAETRRQLKPLIEQVPLEDKPGALYTIKNNTLHLTPKGWLNSDTILSRFYSEILSLFS